MNKTSFVQQAKTENVLALTQGVFQRKCDCGNKTVANRKCTGCTKKNNSLQRKLFIGESNDPLEREADRVADQVMAMPTNSDTGSAPLRIQRFTGQPAGQADTAAPASVDRVLASSGRSMEPVLRHDMEQRFGHDFSQVRVHSNIAAEKSAQEVSASAYAVGNNIVFGAGQFAPGTHEGRRLIAHELTHVVQQSGIYGSNVDKSSDNNGLSSKNPLRLFRETADIGDWLEDVAEQIATERLTALATQPGPAATFTHPQCPANFCQPFTSRRSAIADLVWAGPLILAGIARKVNSRVVPLWASYLTGGSSTQNLSADFGADFTASSTTVNTSSYLVGELSKDIETNQSTLMSGRSNATIDFTPRLSAALTVISTPNDPNEMNFDVIGDIAGNVAGGIGTDQLAFPIGARPSPFNDDRDATITATLASNLGGGVTVTPIIDFSIHDTIDLCPGNCGAPAEQVATIPLSRFEATGLVGDVPFEINFPAPPAALTPFVVLPPTPTPGPVPGVTTATSLRIRAAATTASAILGLYPNGSAISILCETPGETINGNSTWDKTNLGFVSDHYVSRTGVTTPPVC